jgi:hypothetical protein
MRRIFGLKREEVAVGWRTLPNEFQNVYSLPNIIYGDEVKEDGIICIQPHNFCSPFTL